MNGFEQNAWLCLEEIAKILEGLDLHDPSLMRGAAGLAIFYHYLYRTTQQPKHHQLSLQFLEEATTALEQQVLGSSLADGITGIAFALDHLQKQNNTEDGCEPIDEALYEALSGGVWEGERELLYGHIGLGVYCLERLPSPVAKETLCTIVTLIESFAEKKPEGLTWLTLPDSPFSMSSLSGCYNLGLLHGIPGVLAFLAKCAAAQVEVERCKFLLQEGLRWFLGQQLPAPKYGFPEVAGRNQDPPSAICYGHLGVASALQIISRCTQDQSLSALALSILRHTANLPEEHHIATDASLCHGSAGLAHVFLRAYQNTQEPIFKKAALQWFEKTLGYWQPGKSLDSFSFWFRKDGTKEWRSDAGLLNGIAGVGLSLLAVVGPVEPAWDRWLLLS